MVGDEELPSGFEDLRGGGFKERYDIDELVHGSPRRVTFAGRDREVSREVLLELVRPVPLHDRATLERFERRVSKCRRLRHPAIHTPFDAGELADGKLYLVTERPPGVPLDRYLRQRSPGRLGWQDARPLLLALVRGLGAAHVRGVVHGGPSPRYCWIEGPQLGVASLRLLGFGSNVDPDADATRDTHSRTNVLSGDAVFMAPETAGGMFGDARSDVYEAGLLAWLMLVGRPPFHGTNPFQLATMHLTAPVPRLRELGVEVPAGVEELLQTMLAKQPQQRPAGMAEVEQLILEIEGQPEPEAAHGRRGRARARQAGASSREEAVLRLTEKDRAPGGPPAMPRLPGQELVDARWRPEPRPITDAPAREEPTLLLDLHDADSIPREVEGTMVLSLLHERSHDIEGTMVLSLPDESSSDVEGTMVLSLSPEHEPDGSVMPAVQAAPGTVAFTPEQVRALRASASADAGVVTPPAVSGGTQRMSPSEIRALRLAALTSASPSVLTPSAPPAADVEGTQILAAATEAEAEQELGEEDVLELDVEPDEEPEVDLEEQKTNALSPAQVAALRRHGRRGPER